MEEIDQDHPRVLEVQQVVTAQGWMITPNEAVDLVKEVTSALEKSAPTPVPPPPPAPSAGASPAPQQPVPGQPALPAQSQVPSASTSPHALVQSAEKLVRELLPDRIHNLDGSREIPDDLYEELGAILADHHRP